MSQILRFFLHLLRVLSKGAGNHKTVVVLYLKLPSHAGNTRNIGNVRDFEFTQNIGYDLIFWVTWYLTILKTKMGQVGYGQKYRVAERIRVPIGH